MVRHENTEIYFGVLRYTVDDDDVPQLIHHLSMIASLVRKKTGMVASIDSRNSNECKYRSLHGT